MSALWDDDARFCLCGTAAPFRVTITGHPICYSCMEASGFTECDACHLVGTFPTVTEKVSGMGSTETYRYCVPCSENPSSRHERYSLADDVLGKAS